MANIKEVLRQLFRDVRSQKLRTFLTVFGIIWGTVAISLLLAFGTGLHKHLIQQTAGLGDRIMIVWPGLTSMPYEGLGKGRKIRMTEEDVAAIHTAEGVRGVSSEYSSNQKLNYATKTLSVDTSGITPTFGRMRNLIPQSGGRFINEIDMREQRRVLFVGDELAKNLFGKDDPVGKVVQLGGSPFTVVGVLVKKDQDSSYSGPDAEKVFIPGTTYLSITGEKYVDNVIVQGVPEMKSKKVIANISAALGQRLRFDAQDKEALSIWDTTEQFAFFDNFMLAFNGFLGIVGSLTLVVGGIGVSNIMNVVVEERTREIGIKMALGARQRWILSQFLLETILITAVGGAIGFAVSFAICALFPQKMVEYVGVPSLSPLVAVLTAVALGAVGTVAGYFPAREASRLDPVVAMKL
ncbi:MAG: ABC transporter permease [Acidobacteriota bacterium]